MGERIFRSRAGAFRICVVVALIFAGAVPSFTSAGGWLTAQNDKQSVKSQKQKNQKPAEQEPAAEPKEVGPQKAKIRTVTAFLKLNRATYEQQIDETLDFLQKAKAELEQGGYEVQTIRIATQPFGDYTSDLSEDDGYKFLRQLDRLAAAKGFSISIGPAMLHVGDDPKRAELLANALAPAETMDGSLVVAGEDGIHWDAIESAASVIQFLAVHSPRSSANFRFAAGALTPAATPFFPTAYENGNDHGFSLGLQSAGVVLEALSETKDVVGAEKAIVDKLGPQAQEIEGICRDVARKTSWHYLGIDVSPVPMKRESIGAAIEAFTGSWFGSSGTLTTAALITRALAVIPVTRVGYSGLMMPVMEDQTIAKRWGEGSISVDGLLAYSSVCGTGLDVVPLPGRVTHLQLVRILGDVASLSVKWHKPLSARLMPVAGKDAGDRTDFDDPRIVNAMIRPLP